MNTETTIDTEAAVRILKKATCPSLSGKSTLTYNIGCNTEGEIQFQVIANDGGGFWNNDWVSQQSIQAVLDKQPHCKDISSVTFRSIYPSKSTNSPGFLLAVLKDVGLVRPSKTNQRCYELGSPKEFIAEVNALLESASELVMAEPVNAARANKKLSIKGKHIKP